MLFCKVFAASSVMPTELSADTGMIMPPQPGFAFLADAMKTGMAKLLRAGGQVLTPMIPDQAGGQGSARCHY